MKPRLFKRADHWVLKYGFHARSFSLFGAEGPERERIIAAHVAEEPFDSWGEAIEHLRSLYHQNAIRRPVFANKDIPALS